MGIKKEKGVGLVTVVVLTMILAILGTSFLSVSLYQTRQASNQEKGTEAHYLARAGAEAMLEAWQKAPSTDKPSGTFDTVYLNDSGRFVGAEPSSYKGKFDVTITTEGTSTVIKSTGTVRNMQKVVNVTINEITSEIPGPTPDYIDGRLTGFYDYTSGQINNPGEYPSSISNKGTVKNEAKNAKGLKIANKNKGSAKLTFERMLFTSPIQVVHQSIILQSNVIVFSAPIDFKSNGNLKGDITLQVYGALNGVTPIVRTKNGVTGNWGVVVIDGVGYFYKDIAGGIVIKSQSDITAHCAAGNMDIITDPDELNRYIGGVVPTMLKVTSYSILWS